VNVDSVANVSELHAASIFYLYLQDPENGDSVYLQKIINTAHIHMVERRIKCRTNSNTGFLINFVLYSHCRLVTQNNTQDT
jgi:hypothetical protein